MFGNLVIRHLMTLLYAIEMGCVWERMIKTIKMCLYKSIGRKVIAYCVLLTLVSDIQKAINSRPLTYRCSSDIGLDIIALVNFISPYIKEGLMLKAAEDEQTTFTNPPSNSEFVNSLQLRDNLLRKFIAFIMMNTFLP